MTALSGLPDDVRRELAERVLPPDIPAKARAVVAERRVRVCTDHGEIAGDNAVPRHRGGCSWLECRGCHREREARRPPRIHRKREAAT